MKVHRKWIALVAVTAIPFFSKAGPLTHISGVGNNGDKDDWHVTQPAGWEPNGGSKWLGEQEGPARFDYILDDFSHRELQWRHHRSDDDHDRHSNGRGDKGGHTDSGPPVWTHTGDRDGTSAVSESASTALLLAASFVGLLTFGATRKARPTAASSILPDLKFDNSR
jgi:hypothetical protein